MVDIHSHILPNVDDGSKSLDMTRNILQQYVQQGITKVICTPHQNRDCHRAEVLKQGFQKLVEEVRDIPIQLFLGAEIYYYSDILRDLKNGSLLTLNQTPYVLVEFSTSNPTEIADIIYELKIAGYMPIVAHIERYFYLTKQDYFAIKENGGLIQVNASAIEHKHFFKTVKYLLKNDLVDFIASDCHNDSQRKVDFKPIREYILKKFPQLYPKLWGTDKIV
jgi:protein-tyrosine phosphatase